MTVIGISVAFLVLFLSALGSVVTRMAARAFDKNYISSFIGLSIFVFGLLSVFIDEPLLRIKVGIYSDIWSN